MVEPNSPPLSSRRLVDNESLLPVIPGEASVSELFRSIWVYTAGARRWLFALGPLGLILLGLTTVIPLVVGRTLDAALSERADAASVERYIDVRRSLRIGAIASGESGDIAAPLALVLRTDYVKGLFDGLFPDGRPLKIDVQEVRRVAEGTQNLGLVTLTAVEAVIADGEVSRYELETLAGSFQPDSSAVVLPEITDLSSLERAVVFDVVVSTLLNDADLAADRRNSARLDLAGELALFVAVIVALVAVRSAVNRIAVRITQHAGTHLRLAVFRQVHDTALLDAGAIGRPSMISRCGGYVNTVESALRVAAVSGVPALGGLALSLIVLTVLDLFTGLLITLVVLLLELVRRRRSSGWSSTVTERLDTDTALSEYVDAVVSHAPAIRMMKGQRMVRDRFAVLTDSVNRFSKRVTMTGYRVDVVTSTVGLFGVLVVLAGVGLARGAVPLAAATASVLYVGRIAESLATLPAIIEALQVAAPNQRKLLRILRTSAMRPDPVEPVPVGECSELTVAAVSWRPPNGSQPIRRVSLQADRSAWTLLIGPEGSGASELLALMAGVANPDEGLMSIGDVDLASATHQNIAQSVAVLPRDPVAVPGTLAANLCLGLDQVPPDSELIAALEAVGLGPLLQTGPNGLAERLGGPMPMGQDVRIRLGFARLLVHPGRIVLVDDPTDGIDTEVALQLWGTLRVALVDRVVLVSTRRLDLISTTDQVIVMRSGVVAERGRRNQLVAAGGAFARLWNREHESGLDIAQLRDIPGLSDLADEVLDSLTRRLVPERFAEGETIIEAGTQTDRLFVVADGQVELLDGLGGSRIALLRPGDHFGEVDPDQMIRSPVTARALSATVLRSLHRHAVSSGATGILERPTSQRIAYSVVARNGSATREHIAAAVGPGAEEAIEALLADHLLVESGDSENTLRVGGTQRRQRSVALLDSLFGDPTT